MLISHKKKFIFFHNYKVAGTSLRKYFREYQNGFTPLLSKVLHRLGIQKIGPLKQFHSHLTPYEAKAYLSPEVFDNYFKFGFVRNPWSWQVSLYTYMLKTPHHPQHSLIKSMTGFDQYLDWRVNHDLKFQKDFFFDSGNQQAVDFIGKIERLNDDVNTICDHIGIPFREIPRLNVSAKQKWTEFYDLKHFDLVAEVFKKDIEMFGYNDDPGHYGIKQR